MSNKINTNLTEQIMEPTVTSSTDPINKSNLPVDFVNLDPSPKYIAQCVNQHLN